MAIKPDDLWDLHSAVASYVVRTKKLCDFLLKEPVDEPAILKLLAEIQPSPKLHKPKKYYAFGVAYVAANQKVDFQLNPLYANWHHRFVRDADEFHRRLRELRPESSASFDFKRAASIAAEFTVAFKNCTRQFLKKELNAALGLLSGGVPNVGDVGERRGNVGRHSATRSGDAEERPSQYATLAEMVEHSGKSARSLRKHLTDGVLPPPSIQQSGRDPDQWDWELVKPILERIREESQSFSVSGLAKKWGVGTKKIRALIDGGELKAINTSAGPGKRPRYSISRDVVERLEQSRAGVPMVGPVRRKSAAPNLDGVTQYF